jgi:SH3 domain protein
MDFNQYESKISGQRIQMAKNTHNRSWKKCTGLTLGVILAFSFVGQARGVTNAYVTDTYKITFRTGPSLENKIISMLSSGQPLEVLETQGDWSHVRLVENGESPMEGWVLSRYLTTRIPWERQANALKKENDELKEKLIPKEMELKDALRREKEISEKLQETTSALQKVNAAYESLKEGSADFLKLRESHQIIESKLEIAQKEVRELGDENERLRASERNKWFAIGALVLLCGFTIGVIIGRQQKKRRSSYY